MADLDDQVEDGDVRVAVAAGEDQPTDDRLR